MNSAINYLDAQFSALDFNNSDSFESTTGTNDPSSVAALSNKYSQNVSASASHSDLPAMNSFQAAQPSKQNLPSSNISSVLNQNNKVLIYFFFTALELLILLTVVLLVIHYNTIKLFFHILKC